MGIVGHLDISPAGQCQVTYCVATDHNGGTQHHDFTGATFTSCTHGNLSSWDPCEHCGHGDDTDPIGRLLTRLVREHRKISAQIRYEEIPADQVEHAKAALGSLVIAIGAAVRIRLGQEIDVTAAEIEPTGKRYLDSIPKAGR